MLTDCVRSLWSVRVLVTRAMRADQRTASRVGRIHRHVYWRRARCIGMILQQFYLNCLAHASYLVGDEQTRIAAVVDPQRDVDRYLEFAAAHRLRIAHVFLTHLHADFVAGHLELRDRAGATIYLGAAAQAEYAFTPLRDGDRVDFGRVRLQAIETPGHTPESVSIAVYDLDRSAVEPHAVLTGDTLFVGDVGRPDLRAALGWSATELGNLLYDSIRAIRRNSRLRTLPEASTSDSAANTRRGPARSSIANGRSSSSRIPGASRNRRSGSAASASIMSSAICRTGCAASRRGRISRRPS